MLLIKRSIAIVKLKAEEDNFLIRRNKMAIMKIKLTQEQVKLLMSMNAILPNSESYAYFRLPWVKLDRGSDEGEFYVHEKDYPKDLKRSLRDDMCFEQWVWDHSTCGLTEVLDFSKYGKYIDSWSITIDGETITNPSLEEVWRLYQKSKR